MLIRHIPGQVRSECLMCYSEQAVVAHPWSSVRDRNKTGGGGSRGGGAACTGGYKGVRAVRPESVAGGGWFEVLWNLECPVGLRQRK